MKELTDRQAGEIIAHWRRKPTADDMAMVRQIVGDALKPYKKICTVKFRVAKSDIPTLGYGSIMATIKCREPKQTIKTVKGDTVTGLDAITIQFTRQAGILDYGIYGERQKEEAEAFAQKSRKDAMAYIDGLHWDGEVVQMYGITNGKIRQYRKRYTFPYQGLSHFSYAPSWAKLAKGVKHYLEGIFKELRLA